MEDCQKHGGSSLISVSIYGRMENGVTCERANQLSLKNTDSSIQPLAIHLLCNVHWNNGTVVSTLLNIDWFDCISSDL